MATGKDVRSFLVAHYASYGVEVRSSGDASVTVSVPVHTDLTALVYDLKEEFNADCDLKLESGLPVVVIHLARNYRSTATHFMVWTASVAALACAAALGSQYFPLPLNVSLPF